MAAFTSQIDRLWLAFKRLRHDDGHTHYLSAVMDWLPTVVAVMEIVISPALFVD